MHINILDGHDVIGGNKILITAEDSSSIFLDFGKNYPLYGSFFEEFLTPRVTAGIYDYWKLGLLPHFSGIYRESLAQFVKGEVDSSPRLDIQALLLSHAHLDHAGYIPFIDERVPIITSHISYSFLQSIQDIAGGSLTEDYCSASVRELSVSKNGEVKLEKKKKSKEEPNEIPRNFNFNEQGSIGSFEFRKFPIDHSILGASAFYIVVDGVRIAYTGDLRFHGTRGLLSKQFFEFIKQNGVDVLVCEGTRVPKIEEIEKTLKEDQLTEDDVKEASLSVVNAFKGKLVIADFGARNIERLKVFLDVAKETNRKLAITFKDAHLLDLLKDEIDPATGAKIDYINAPNIVIIESKRERNYSWKDSLSEQHRENIITLSDISKDPGLYIICYSYWDMPNLLDLEIKDRGAYIYSTSEAYSEEQMIDTKRLFNWLKQLNLEPFGVELDERGEPVFTRDYHVSGHSSFRDLVQEIEYVRPDIVLPVHSEHIETYKQIFGSKVVLEDEIEV